MSSAFGGPRNLARAPEKGVFPLDHFAECKQMAKEYLKCVDFHDGETAPCRELSKKYLECRMERQLMAKQDLGELGLQEPQQQEQPQQQ